MILSGIIAGGTIYMHERSVLTRREVEKLGITAVAGMAVGAFIDYLSPFASVPLPENWNKKLEVKTTLPENLWGVALNAFTVWKYDEETWNTLFRMMDETGATIVRISSCGNGHFRLADQLPEDMAQMKKFLSYFRENAMNGNNGGRNFSVNFDFYDGYNLFQKGKYNGVYTDKPHQVAEEKIDKLDRYAVYYDARDEKFTHDTTPENDNDRFLAQCKFYDSPEIKEGFKETLDYYLTELSSYSDVITAFTLANEIAPVNIVNKKDDKLIKIFKGIRQEKLLNTWYVEMIDHIRNKFRYKNRKPEDSLEDRPIILGNADPTIINEELFYIFRNIVLSVHGYPGNLLLMHKVRNLLKTAALPVIFQEGNVPDKIDKKALIPFLDFDPENTDIDINEDELTYEFTDDVIQLASWDREFHFGHVGYWGAGPKHNDKTKIMPDYQPKTKKRMKELSILLKPKSKID